MFIVADLVSLRTGASLQLTQSITGSISEGADINTSEKHSMVMLISLTNCSLPLTETVQCVISMVTDSQTGLKNKVYMIHVSDRKSYLFSQLKFEIFFIWFFTFQSTIFQLHRYESSWVEPVLSKD